MVEEGFSWIYLIFFLIPLVRIIPRLVRKWKKGNSAITENQFTQKIPGIEERQEPFERPQNKEMQVLGELNNGVKDFNKIQKNLDIDNQKLEKILKDLEAQELMEVIKKKGITGIKVELYPTEKGFRKYYT